MAIVPEMLVSHLFRQRQSRTLCGVGVPVNAVSVELAIDAPRLLVGMRLCADCVRRFHRIRDDKGLLYPPPLLDRSMKPTLS